VHNRVTYVEDNFVQKLQGITTEHQGNNMPVNPAAQSVDVNNRLTLSGKAVLAEEFPSIVDMSIWGRGAIKLRVRMI
jgi:hypothetical protein